MPSERVYNFSAGPCILPVEVLEECQTDMLNYKGAGMGVMEMSHRGKDFVNIYKETEKNLRDVLNVPDNYKVLFQQGGASLQFASVPLNFFGGEKTHADYAVTGQWGEKAVKEATKYGTSHAVCNTKPTKFTHIPPVAEWQRSEPEKTAYLHYTDNETVNGVEFSAPPEVDVPLVADMSSNFCTRPINVAKHALIYAGAQKNAGIAGNTVVIVDEKYTSQEMKSCPTVCSYKSQLGADGMYNTPPCYAIYVTGLYLKYTKEKGGLSFWEEICAKKSAMIYDVIDGSDGYYTCPIQKDSRSRVNIPFQIAGGQDELEKKFLKEGQEKCNLYTLAGHRTVGGIRASLYNGMPMAGVEALRDFMKSFMEENPLQNN